MKTRITVAWASTVQIDVDPEKMKDESYRSEIQVQAAQAAWDNINWKDGMVTDCEAFPDLLE